MPPKLVKATIEDMPEVAKLFRISRESELPYLPKLHTPEEDLEFFRTIVFPHQKVTLLKDKEKLLGFVTYDFDWIHHLYLLPEATGKGFGAKLLKSARSYRKRMKLWVFKRNERAIRFYKKHGFHIIKETDGAENEEREPDVLMHWPAVKWQKIRDLRVYESTDLYQKLEDALGQAAVKELMAHVVCITQSLRTLLRGLGLQLPSYTHLYVYLTEEIAEGETGSSASLESWFRATGMGISTECLLQKNYLERHQYFVDVIVSGLLQVAAEDDFDTNPILIAKELVSFLIEPGEFPYGMFLVDELLIVVTHTLSSPVSWVYKTINVPPTEPSDVYVTWRNMNTGEIHRKLATKLQFAWQIDHFVNRASVKDGIITLLPKKTANNVLEKCTIQPDTQIPIRVSMNDG